MAQPPPPISPDGKYWWDGQAWQPLFLHDEPAPPAAPVLAQAPVPVQPAASPPSYIRPLAPPAPRPVGRPISGSMLAILSGVVLLLVVVIGTGVWVLTHQPAAQPDIAASITPSAAASPA